VEYRFSRIQAEHVEQIVKIHMKAFPNFFLTFLGPRFLKEFYASFVNNPAGIGLVGVDKKSGAVSGFIVGPTKPQGYFKQLLIRRWWAFCLASIEALIQKPSVAPRLWRALYYRGDTPQHISSFALLSSIAVSPAVQSTGLGRKLVTAFITEVKQRGGDGIFLTTDAENNAGVNRFYQKLGFHLEASFQTLEGRKMNRYVFLPAD